MLLSFGRDGSTRKTIAESQPAGLKETALDMRLLADCRWMSRIALFSACACFAIIRSQFALVFTGLGYAESQFGMYLTIYALCNFVALVAAGRWALWHFKPSLLIVGQAILLFTLLMTIYGRALSVLFASSILLGVAYGFAYCSHLYYGASGSKKRSGRMAIHEIVISLGLTIGSAAGGYLCEHVGLYAPVLVRRGSRRPGHDRPGGDPRRLRGRGSASAVRLRPRATWKSRSRDGCPSSAKKSCSFRAESS